MNTLALPRIFTDCFEYPIPYLTQSTQKVLAKFSCPKKSHHLNSRVPFPPPTAQVLYTLNPHQRHIWGRAPLIFRPNWGAKGQKKFFLRPPLILYLRVWMTAPLLIWRSGSVTSNDHFLWREYLTQVWHKLGDVTTWTKPYRFGWKNKQKQKIMVHSPITKELWRAGSKEVCFKGLQHNCRARYNATASLKSCLFTDVPFSLQRCFSIQTNKTVGNLLTIWIPNLVQGNLDLIRC